MASSFPLTSSPWNPTLLRWSGSNYGRKPYCTLNGLVSSFLNLRNTSRMLNGLKTGSGTMGDPTFDKFFASNVPSLVSQPEEAQKINDAGSLLIDQIGV